MDAGHTTDLGGTMSTKILLYVTGTVMGGLSLSQADLVMSIVLKGVSVLSFAAAFILTCLTIYHKYIKK